MRVWIATISALTVLVCGEASAQTWSADAAAQQCTIDGAFGQTFGSRQANGRTRPINRPFADYDRTVAPPMAYEPFDRFELKLTPRSRLIVQVTAMAAFPDEAAAVRAYNELVAAYNRGGRFAFQSEDTIVRAGAPEGIAFKTEEHDARLTAMVARSERTVYLLCAHGPLMTQGFEEAFSEFDRRARAD